MKIIIVGCGKVGYSIAKNLATERGVNITLVDIEPDTFGKASESIDAMLVKGNGLNAETLIEAGAEEADLIISAASTDETNILCCILAKHLGTKHTAARVRHPDYALHLDKFWKKLGLDMVINPEYETAREISRLLRFPTVDDIDTFVDGRVELVAFKVSDAPEFFEGKSVAQIFHAKKMNILLAMIERNNAAVIPHGDLIFEKNDIIRMLGRPSYIMDFFALIGKNTERIKNTVIIGGGRITYYLIELLHRHSRNTAIKVIEIDKDRCEALSERFPRCTIINGDGTDEDIILSGAVDQASAVVCLTDRDENNTIISLYSLQAGARKAILKINYINKNMVKDLGLGSIVSPQSLTSDQMTRYVRGLSTVSGGSINTIYKIFDRGDNADKVEAVEFNIDKNARCINTPIKNMKLKKSILIGCIVRNSNIIIPSGDVSIQAGDSVIIISKNDIVHDPDDILDD